MQNRKDKRPRKDGDWNLVSASPLLAIWFGICSLLGFAFSGAFLIGGLAKMASKLSLFLSIVCLVIWLYSKRDKFIGRYPGDQQVIINGIKQFLFANHLYVDDDQNSDKIIYPLVRISKHSVQIQALGGLRKKLLSKEVMDELQAFADNSDTHIFFRQSYYDHGWVCFVFGSDLDSDRLHFK